MANPPENVVHRRHTHKSYVTGRKGYSLTEVYEHFGSSLPRMFIINAGYEGDVVEKPLLKGQILRLECASSKDRLAARAITNDGRIQYFSFYEHTSVINAKTPTTGQSIQSMMQDRKLPVTVSLKRSLEGVSEASQLQFLNYFEERHLAGNIIHLDFFDQDVLYIPTSLSSVRLVEVLGIKGDMAETWKKYQTKCERIAGGLEYDTQFTRIDIVAYKDVPDGIVTSETEAERYIQLGELHDMCMAADVYEALATSLKQDDEELTEDDIYVEVSKLLADKNRKDGGVTTTLSQGASMDEEKCQNVEDNEDENDHIYEYASEESENKTQAKETVNDQRVKDGDGRPPLPPRGPKRETSKPGSIVKGDIGGGSANSKYMNNVPRGEASVVRKVDSSDSDNEYEEVSPEDKLPSPCSHLYDRSSRSSKDKGTLNRQSSKDDSTENAGSPKTPKSPFKSKHFLNDLTKMFKQSKHSTDDNVVTLKHTDQTKTQACSRPTVAAKPGKAIAPMANTSKFASTNEPIDSDKRANVTASVKSDTASFNAQRNVNEVKPIAAGKPIDAAKTERSNATAVGALNKSNQNRPVATAKPIDAAKSEKSNVTSAGAPNKTNENRPVATAKPIDAAKSEESNVTSAGAPNKPNLTKPVVATAKPTSVARPGTAVAPATATVSAACLPKVASGADVQDLSIEEVSGYLKQLRLEKLVEKFQREMVDGVILSSLNAQMFMEEFGISRLEAARLEKFAHFGHLPS